MSAETFPRAIKTTEITSIRTVWRKFTDWAIAFESITLCDCESYRVADAFQSVETAGVKGPDTCIRQLSAISGAALSSVTLHINGTKTTYRSALVVMMMAMMLAVGCLHAPSDTHSLCVFF